MSKYIWGIDPGSGFTYSAFVQQWFRPDGSVYRICETRMGSEDMNGRIDRIKKNKYSIVTIMMKQIASEARERHPELYVEAHPAYGVNQAMLNIRRLKTNDKLVVSLKPSESSRPGWISTTNPDTNNFTAYLEFYRGNKVSRKDTPVPYSFALDDPEGTTSFEKWIENYITGWFYADTSKAGVQAKSVDNHDRSTTL